MVGVVVGPHRRALLDRLRVRAWTGALLAGASSADSELGSGQSPHSPRPSRARRCGPKAKGIALWNGLSGFYGEPPLSLSWQSPLTIFAMAAAILGIETGPAKLFHRASVARGLIGCCEQATRFGIGNATMERHRDRNRQNLYYLLARMQRQET